MAHRLVFKMRLENNLYKLVTKAISYERHHAIRSILIVNKYYLISKIGYNSVDSIYATAASKLFNQYMKEEVFKEQ